MPEDSVSALGTLSRKFGPAAAARKERLLNLLKRIASQKRFRAGELAGLHDTLSFMRAYPDNRRILRMTRELVASLRDHGGRASLRNTGFPGSACSHPYSYAVLQWLVQLFPGCLELDWSEIEDTAALEGALSLMVTPGESDGLDDDRLTIKEWLEEWLEHCRGGREQTGLELVLEMFRGSALPSRAQGYMFEVGELPIRYRLSVPGSGRAEVVFPARRIFYQKRDIPRDRFEVTATIVRPLTDLTTASPSTGRKLIDVGLAALCSRNLEIYPLTNANPRDVSLADCGRGLRVVLVGVLPEFRGVLESLYFFLILKNGVPIAYGPAAVFLGCCEMGINLFPEFRGGEIRYLYAQFMRVLYHVLAVRYFFLTRYGMGEDNEDAIRSGAFWFYRKLGFATTNPKVEAGARAEEAKMRARPDYRSDSRTLRRLSHTEAVLDLSGGACRPTDLGKLALLESRYIAERFGGDRRRAQSESTAKVARFLGIPPKGRALASLAPLLSMIPTLRAWTTTDKARLATILRAKEGRSEIRAARLLSRHGAFRSAIARLVESAARAVPADDSVRTSALESGSIELD